MKNSRWSVGEAFEVIEDLEKDIENHMTTRGS
jgi:hypothetical protein